MDTMHFFLIQTGLFLETISFWYLVGQLNNSAPMINFPLVQGRSNKTLGGGSGGGGVVVIPLFYLIF